MTATTHMFDVSTDRFDAEVIQRSLKTPVLIDFWAGWCEPCKQLGPVLEKLAGDYHGAFVLAKVDVEVEQQLATALQIRSIPTVILVKGGQLVDGFPGALPEAQVREFLSHHGITPAEAPEPPSTEPTQAPPLDPQAELQRLRTAVEAEPSQDELKLDLALALLRVGEPDQARALLDALPAVLATDDRTRRARAQLGFAAVLKDAPASEALQRRLQADPDDHAARHLLGVRQIVAGQPDAGVEHLLELLRRDRTGSDGLARKALLDAFLVIDDAAVVGAARRRMASLLF